MHWGEYQSNTRHNSIENDKKKGCLYQHLYRQVAYTLEMGWESV